MKVAAMTANQDRRQTPMELAEDKPNPPMTYHFIFDLQSTGVAVRTVLSNNPQTPANFLWLREKRLCPQKHDLDQLIYKR